MILPWIINYPWGRGSAESRLYIQNMEPQVSDAGTVSASDGYLEQVR